MFTLFVVVKHTSLVSDPSKIKLLYGVLDSLWQNCNQIDKCVDRRHRTLSSLLIHRIYEYMVGMKTLVCIKLHKIVNGRNCRTHHVVLIRLVRAMDTTIYVHDALVSLCALCSSVYICPTALHFLRVTERIVPSGGSSESERAVKGCASPND